MFVGERVVWFVPVLFGLITITFFAGHASVRNPCAVWVGPHASPDTVRNCIEYFGVNRPVWDQYTGYLSNLFQGNWGKDPQGGQPVLPLILPAASLALLNLGIATRMTRSSMLEVLPLDYVKTARMKGLSDFWVLYKHALRNSLISTVTVLGTTAGSLLSWIVVVEEIFLWPGIGKYAFDSILSYNFAGTLGVVVFFAIVVVVANLVSDVLYGVLDPRVEWR